MVLKENPDIKIERDHPEDPLIRASQLIQGDWVIIEWDKKEQGYVLNAGVIHFYMRCLLQQKFNQAFSEIYVPVKAFMKNLLTKVYDLFKKMSPEASLWRGDWAVFNDLTGSLDLYTPTGSLDRTNANASTVCGPNTGRELTFRAEYQTLRKLPKAKCIILDEIEHFPTKDVHGLERAIETLDKEMVIYKGSKYWHDAAIKYFQNIINKREYASKSLSEKYWILPILSVGIAASAIAMGMKLMKSS